MKRIDVVKKGDSWIGKTSEGTVAHGSTKVEAVRNTAAVAKTDPKPATVKIHKQDGTIQEERTYPRSADPRGSRG